MRTIILFFIIIPFMSVGQFFTKTYQTREVILDSKDSIIVFDVVSEKVDIDINNSIVYHWFNSKQIKKNMGGFAGYLLHNNYKLYTGNKSLIETGTFYLGAKNGQWKTWNNKGGLMSIKNYNKGVLNGEVIEYNQYGHKIKHQQYKNGFLEIDYLTTQDSTQIKHSNKSSEKSKKTKSFNLKKWLNSKKSSSELDG